MKKSNAIKHLAILPDGNGRWAESQGLQRIEGHKAGCKNLENITQVVLNYNIEYLTLFIFSTENWKRPADEVESLMLLFRDYLLATTNFATENNVRVKVIGERKKLDSHLISLIDTLEETTQNNNTLKLQIALNYGSRDEVRRAISKIHSKAFLESELDENLISNHLDTCGIPDPDLFIRTGGEYRLSNYLLWQLAYTELFFSDKLWPDFDETDFAVAIDSFQQRKRRFGEIRTNNTNI